MFHAMLLDLGVSDYLMDGCSHVVGTGLSGFVEVDVFLTVLAVESLASGTGGFDLRL